MLIPITPKKSTMKIRYQKQSLPFVFTMALVGCLSANAATEPTTLMPAAIPVSTLPAIQNDDLRAAISAFERSCAKYISQGPNKPISPGYTGVKLSPDYSRLMLACADASALLASNADQQSLLVMLDKHFEAVEVISDTGASLLTAYYEPTFPISKKKIDSYLDWPLHRKPSNLPAGVAWFSRQAIETGQADAELKENVLSYTDRWSAYVLQVQGSGVGILPDGTSVRLIYGGKNGQSYASIGRALVERGEIAADKISMQEIKSWLDSHSREEQDALYWRNPSYVFFEIDDRPALGRVGPPGAMSLDVGLTPNRSVAVDWAHFVPGMPLFIKGTLGNGQALSQLVIAQDRGGAIVSKVRVDLFLGAGNDAAETAGKTRDENLKLWTLQFRTQKRLHP